MARGRVLLPADARIDGYRQSRYHKNSPPPGLQGIIKVLEKDGQLLKNIKNGFRKEFVRATIINQGGDKVYGKGPADEALRFLVNEEYLVIVEGMYFTPTMIEERKRLLEEEVAGRTEAPPQEPRIRPSTARVQPTDPKPTQRPAPEPVPRPTLVSLARSTPTPPTPEAPPVTEVPEVKERASTLPSPSTPIDSPVKEVRGVEEEAKNSSKPRKGHSANEDRGLIAHINDPDELRRYIHAHKAAMEELGRRRHEISREQETYRMRIGKARSRLEEMGEDPDAAVEKGGELYKIPAYTPNKPRSKSSGQAPELDAVDEASADKGPVQDINQTLPEEPHGELETAAETAPEPSETHSDPRVKMLMERGYTLEDAIAMVSP